MRAAALLVAAEVGRAVGAAGEVQQRSRGGPACKPNEYCAGTIKKALAFWNDDECDGDCLPCYLDPDKSQNGQTCLTCELRAGAPSCTSCGFGLAAEQLQRAHELFVLLEDREGRTRCYARASSHKAADEALPPLCRPASQGEGIHGALSLGQLWGVQDPGTREYTLVPARLAPYLGRGLSARHDPSKISLYVGLYPPATRVTEEMAAQLAGTAMGAEHLLYFEISKDATLLGRPRRSFRYRPMLWADLHRVLDSDDGPRSREDAGPLGAGGEPPMPRSRAVVRHGKGKEAEKSNPEDAELGTSDSAGSDVGQLFDRQDAELGNSDSGGSDVGQLFDRQAGGARGLALFELRGATRSTKTRSRFEVLVTLQPPLTDMNRDEPAQSPFLSLSEPALRDLATCLDHFASGGKPVQSSFEEAELVLEQHWADAPARARAKLHASTVTVPSGERKVFGLAHRL